MPKLIDMEGKVFMHPTHGYLFVDKRGKDFEGACDIRVAWECIQQKPPHNVFTITSRNIKRYLNRDKTLKRGMYGQESK